MKLCIILMETKISLYLETLINEYSLNMHAYI